MSRTIRRLAATQKFYILAEFLLSRNINVSGLESYLTKLSALRVVWLFILILILIISHSAVKKTNPEEAHNRIRFTFR